MDGILHRDARWVIPMRFQLAIRDCGEHLSKEDWQLIRKALHTLLKPGAPGAHTPCIICGQASQDKQKALDSAEL